LEDDPILKDLLKQLDRIETRRGFAKWKNQFLTQFEMHLEGTNVTKASHKYHSFAKRIDRLALLLKTLEGLIRSGDCSTEKCTVKSRQSLSELQKALTGMIEHTQALVPGTLEVEQKAGYTKFDMGAVLVRDGFVEYDRLCICNEILLHMKDIALTEVADRQLLEEMDRYWQKVEAFYQIMGTDLGLHGAILRCRKILRAEDDEFLQYENNKDLHPFDKEALEEVRALSEKEKQQKAKSLYNDSASEEDDEDGDEKLSELTTPTNSASEPPPTSDLDAKQTKSIKKKKSNDMDDLDAKQPKTRGTKKDDWENLREDPPKSTQRFEKVEIYGLDLPLRLIKLGDSIGSSTDLSDVSDYESWCWALELPEPAPIEDLPDPTPVTTVKNDEDFPDEELKAPSKKEAPVKEKSQKKEPEIRLDEFDDDIFGASTEKAESEPEDLVSVDYDLAEKKTKKTKKKGLQRRSRMKSAPAKPRDDIDPETGLPYKLLGLSKMDDDDLLSSDDDEIAKARRKKGEKAFKWNSEGYYHGDAAGWRIASSMRKANNDSKS